MDKFCVDDYFGASLDEGDMKTAVILQKFRQLVPHHYLNMLY